MLRKYGCHLLFNIPKSSFGRDTVPFVIYHDVAHHNHHVMTRSYVHQAAESGVLCVYECAVTRYIDEMCYREEPYGHGDSNAFDTVNDGNQAHGQGGEEFVRK
jgi:hypothetical protein